MKKYSFRICLERFKNVKSKIAQRVVKLFLLQLQKAQLLTGYSYKSFVNETEVLVFFYSITN